MKKTKLGFILVSLFAITNAAACNISFDKGGSSSSLKSVEDVSEDFTSSAGEDVSSNIEISSEDSDSSSVVDDADLISISFDRSSLSLMPGSTARLNVIYNPTNAAEKRVDWSSSNSNVASVDSNGLVTAGTTGNAVITATSKASSAIKATCSVSVIDNVILAGVDSKHEFVIFEQNKSVSSDNDNGFYDRNQKYKVGDDNNFNVKPALTVLDSKTYLPVTANSWAHDFTITATLNGEAAGSEYFSVVRSESVV